MFEVLVEILEGSVLLEGVGMYSVNMSPHRMGCRGFQVW